MLGFYYFFVKYLLYFLPALNNLLYKTYFKFLSIFSFFELAAFCNNTLCWSFSWLWSYTFKSIKNLPSFINLSKYCVFSVKPIACNKCHEELWTISVWSSICHWKISSSWMFNSEVFIFKLHSVNWFSSSSISGSKITSLSHKFSNNSMESRTFIMKSFSTFAHSLFSSAQCSKILCSIWTFVCIKLHFYSTSDLTFNCYIEKYFWVYHDLFIQIRKIFNMIN